MIKDKLAFFGGKKSITFKSPHWIWPPKSKGRIKAINDYYSKESMDEIYFPKIVKKFEKNFANYHKKKYALTFNSGTSSLHASIFSVGIKEGDEVLVPALTFHSTATPLFQFGAIPVVCDCESDTGNIDPKSIISKISKKTKAIIITHLCGHPCEMNKILNIAKKNNLHLIEDCSHAHGSKYKGKLVGTFSDISCFSLGNQKLLASGEGGILLTDNKKLFERALIISDFSQRIFEQLTFYENRKFVDTGLGFKHRIHPVSAAIANYELTKIDYYIKKRNQVLNNFSKKISLIPGISPPVTRSKMHRGAFFGYRIFFNSKKLNNIDIDLFIKVLSAEGMEVRRASHNPLHLLNLFSNKAKTFQFLNKKVKLSVNRKSLLLPKSEYFYNTTISIPTFTFEKKALIEQYIKCFKKVCYYLSKNKID